MNETRRKPTTGRQQGEILPTGGIVCKEHATRRPSPWGQDVKHVQHAKNSEDTSTAHCKSHVAEEIASDIRFISFVKSLLKDGSVISTTDLRTTYNGIQQKNGVDSPCEIKEKLISHIDNIHFMKPKQCNQSE